MTTFAFLRGEDMPKYRNLNCVKEFKIKYFFILEATLCLFLSLFCDSVLTLILMNLFLSVFLVYYVRKNYLYTICFLLLAYFNYSFMLNYINDSPFDLFSTYKDTFVGIRSLQVLMVFLISIIWFMPKEIKQFDESRLYSETKVYNIVHILLSFLVLLITILGYENVEIGKRGSQSTLFGYVVLLIITGLYFSKNSKNIKKVYFVLSIIFIVKNLLHGERLYVLQMVIVFYLYFLPQKYKKNYGFLALIAFIGYMGLTYIAEARTFGWGFESVIAAFNNALQRGFALDTAVSAYFTGQTFVEMSFIDSVGQRLYLLILWLFSIVVGGRLSPLSNLSNYTRQFMEHWYGGVLPFYGYYYLSFYGVILFAMLIVFIIKKHNNAHNFKALNFAFVYFIVSVFSWYLYSPSSMTRGFLIALLIYYSVIYGNKLLSVVKMRINNKVKKN